MSNFIRIWLAPFIAVLALLALLRTLDANGPMIQLTGAASTFGTLLLAIVVQALPFLVLGVLVSGAIAAWMPKDVLAKVTPRSPWLAVPTAGAAGMVLPGCECASVPVSQSLMRRGLSQAAALAFLLAAPAVNPIVLVATAVAFQGNPMMVWARLAASLLAVVVIGWVWIAVGKQEWMKSQSGHEHEGQSKADIFRETATHDLLQAGGFLVVGAAAAAALKVFVPAGVLATLTENPWLAILIMAALAVALSLCSEADAFVVSSLTTVSPTAQLAFLVVGPMVDIKLFAMQSGAFGTKFATRFMPLTLVVCILSAALVGRLMFGTF
ncbi:permease [uncultured Tessaracoccus sp.]|uniref:permease n=1 Tax=uncultured Tessaracoccus sp. TaxID=905023 RepID=UPI002637CF0D|nr:permease [uncultured Tessaracoccus sp.]